MNSQLYPVVKIACISFCLLFAFSFTARSQDSLLQSPQWAKLKESLNKRNDLISTIRNELGKAGPETKLYADSAASYSYRLYRALDQQVMLNRGAIDSLVQLHRNTAGTLGRTLVHAENESKKTREKILPLLAHLDGVENRIHIAIRSYDQLCVES